MTPFAELTDITRCCLPGNAAPVVASCRAESQAYMRELKDAHEKTKQDLRFEKDKNAMLVSRALELEKEKNALLAAEQAAASLGTNGMSCTFSLSRES